MSDQTAAPRSAALPPGAEIRGFCPSVPAAALMLVLALSACGGGGSESAPDSSPPPAVGGPAGSPTPVAWSNPATGSTSPGGLPGTSTGTIADPYLAFLPALPLPPEPARTLKTLTARLQQGRAVDLELAEAPGAQDLLVPGTITWSVRFSPNANGLVAQGSRITGAPQRAGVQEVVLTGQDAEGNTHSTTFTLATVRVATYGAPTLPPTTQNVAAGPLPRHFTDPTDARQPAGVAIATTDSAPRGADSARLNAQINLGRALFYDTRLSGNNTVACASCHVQAFSFGDTHTVSPGVIEMAAGGTDPVGVRNTPALANVRYFPGGKMFWDVRSPSLELQSQSPLANPVEMDMDLDALPQKLASIPGYGALFEAAFGSPEIDVVRVGRAVAQFQRQLVSYRSRYDQAMTAADPTSNATSFDTVFTPSEQRGRALFEDIPADQQKAMGIDPPLPSAGCSVCHGTAAQILVNGPQNIGLPLAPNDQGATNRGDFKVPSLRNVALTAPYMHDGRFDTLRQVLQFYSAQVQDGPNVSAFMREGQAAYPAPIRRLNLSTQAMEDLEAFMNTLTDNAFLRDSSLSDPFRDDAVVPVPAP